MRILHVFAVVALLILTVQSSAAAASAPPPYAVGGAFASYTAEGGFIPFFSGVEGNITYTVLSVLGNGSMALRIFENITAGTDLNPYVTTINVTDSVGDPSTFPAVPVSTLATGHIDYQNVSASFAQNDTSSVPAGTFSTFEFTGRDSNGTSVHFWFDRSTGLMVEENSGTSAVQLESTNIATPVGQAGGFNGEAAYELVFVLAFVVGGGGFLYMRRHYERSAQAKKDAAKGQPAEGRTA